MFNENLQLLLYLFLQVYLFIQSSQELCYKCHYHLCPMKGPRNMHGAQ